MRSSRVVRASDYQCQSLNSYCLDPNVLRSDTVSYEGWQMKQCWSQSSQDTRRERLSATHML